MADFKKAIDDLLKTEGGYVFDPVDAGGETKYGITDRLDGKVDRMADVDGDGDGDVTIKNLTPDQAAQIYKREFWDEMQGDKIIDQQVANIVFDAFVNSGRSALKQLQRVIKVPMDGHVGNQTVSVLNKLNGKEVFEAFKQARRDFYNYIVYKKPEQKKFIKGWLNRINRFEYKP